MPPKPLTMLHTGIKGLDTILGGGIPAGSVIMLVGAPGTGKTMLILQICFSWAKAERNRRLLVAGADITEADPARTGNAKKKPGQKDRPEPSKKALFFSTLSEPHDKLLEHVSQFDFYNEDLFADYIRLFSLTSILDEGLQKVADVIVTTARQEKATIVAIDGFGALETVSGGPDGTRRFLYRLSAQLNLLGATTFISLERPLELSLSAGDMTVADGIIGLYQRIEGVRKYSRIEIRKLRGVKQLPGLHTYQITSGGLNIYPQAEALAPQQLKYEGASAADTRLSTGLARLDEMMGGGLPKASSSFVAGSPGAGKTMLALHFLQAGLQKDEPALYIGFHESREQLVNKAAGLGFDLREPIETNRLRVVNIAPIQVEPDMVAALIREEVEKYGIKRLTLDDISELERACQPENRTHDFMAALSAYFKSKNITVLYNYRIRKLTGTQLDLTGTPLSLLDENLLLLRLVEQNNELQRLLTILHMRDSQHDTVTRMFNIQPGAGIVLLQSIENEENLLAGNALGHGESKN